MCICQFQYPNLSLSLLVTVSLFSTSITLFLVYKWVHLYHFFKISHISDIRYLFIFISITLGDGWKKFLLQFMLMFCLCFLLRVKVSGRTFRSLIHFEIIFVYGAREWSNFILLHVTVQFSSHTYWRDFSPLYIPVSFVVYWVPIDVGFISGLSILFIYLYFCFCASTMLFWWLGV